MEVHLPKLASALAKCASTGARVGGRVAARQVGKRAAKQVAKKAAKQIAKKAGKRIAKKSGKKVAKKAEKKTAKKSGKKVTNVGTKKASKKAVKKSKKKPINKTMKRLKKNASQMMDDDENESEASDEDKKEVSEKSKKSASNDSSKMEYKDSSRIRSEKKLEKSKSNCFMKEPQDISKPKKSSEDWLLKKNEKLKAKNEDKINGKTYKNQRPKSEPAAVVMGALVTEMSDKMEQTSGVSSSSVGLRGDKRKSSKKQANMSIAVSELKSEESGNKAGIFGEVKNKSNEHNKKKSGLFGGKSSSERDTESSDVDFGTDSEGSTFSSTTAESKHCFDNRTSIVGVTTSSETLGKSSSSLASFATSSVINSMSDSAESVASNQKVKAPSWKQIYIPFMGDANAAQSAISETDGSRLDQVKGTSNKIATATEQDNLAKPVMTKAIGENNAKAVMYSLKITEEVPEKEQQIKSQLGKVSNQVNVPLQQAGTNPKSAMSSIIREKNSVGRSEEEHEENFAGTSATTKDFGPCREKRIMGRCKQSSIFHPNHKFPSEPTEVEMDTDKPVPFGGITPHDTCESEFNLMLFRLAKQLIMENCRSGKQRQDEANERQRRAKRRKTRSSQWLKALGIILKARTEQLSMKCSRPRRKNPKRRRVLLCYPTGFLRINNPDKAEKCKCQETKEISDERRKTSECRDDLQESRLKFSNPEDSQNLPDEILHRDALEKPTERKLLVADLQGLSFSENSTSSSSSIDSRFLRQEETKQLCQVVRALNGYQLHSQTSRPFVRNASTSRQRSCSCNSANGHPRITHPSSCLLWRHVPYFFSPPFYCPISACPPAPMLTNPTVYPQNSVQADVETDLIQLCFPY